MPRFQKVPVIIQAVRWVPGDDKTQSDMSSLFNFPLRNWNHVQPLNQPVIVAPDDTLRIKTLEGTMVAKPGDWVIKGVKGEFYPCKPDIFAETYVEVSE